MKTKTALEQFSEEFYTGEAIHHKCKTCKDELYKIAKRYIENEK